jgi:hypothetical protein
MWVEGLPHMNFAHLQSKRTTNTPPSSSMDSTMNPMVKTLEGEGVGARSLAHNISGVEGRAGTPGWD